MEISKKSYILLCIACIACIILGFVIRFNKDKTQKIAEKQFVESTSENELPQIDYDQFIVDGQALPVIDTETDENGNKVVKLYDYSQIPIRPDRVYLKDNLDWYSYYVECRNADACTIAQNNTSKNLNQITIDGTLYRIPFDIDKLPSTSNLTDYTYSIINNSERFHGQLYGNCNDIYINGNYFFVQTYPDTETINSIVVEDTGMVYEDGISCSICGLNVGMTEAEVVKLMGKGTPSNNYLAIWFQEKYKLNAKSHQSTVYINDTGSIVVTYNEDREVIRISYYTAALRRDISKEVYIEQIVTE